MVAGSRSGSGPHSVYNDVGSVKNRLLRAPAGKCFFFNPKSFSCDQGSVPESFDGTV